MDAIPEIRVTRSGKVVEKVEWDSCRDGEAAFDLTGMSVARVESEIGPIGWPAVRVTFNARIVEVEA